VKISYPALAGQLIEFMLHYVPKRASLIIAAVYAFLYSVLVIYDALLSRFDGLVAGWRYHRLMLIIGLFLVLLVLLMGCFRSRSTLLQNVALSVCSFLFLIGMLEGVSWLVLRTGWITGERPRHHLLNDVRDLEFPHPPFRGDYDPAISFWRRPQDTLVQRGCHGLEIEYISNSHGARDPERSEQSSGGGRVVVVGDSFIEGFMVNTPQRASNLLEAQTGVEHLNFGIQGTSPINYYLTYKHLGKQFDHDALVVGVLPANDFEDFTKKDKVSLIRVPIYRPFWDVSTSPFRLVYSLDSLAQSPYSLSPAPLYHTIDHLFASLSAGEKVMAVLLDNSYTYYLIKGLQAKWVTSSNKHFSRYNEYSDEEWQVFSYSLEKLFEEAAGKKVLVITYPILSEVVAYDATRKNRLSGELKALCDRYQVQYLDLLPYFHAYKSRGNWQDLYVPCDGHWSERGEAYVSEVLLNHPLYRSLLPPKANQQK
jgi:hypothetical protein